ncbi:Uncharacterized protein Adt_11821 [Abeliophyllum distichum]|uniref:Uncharacterized protein n=1 Tax=Abeliophyllum distichum TaxID=126358 RepID=A0ABD1UNY9_9LAMI
MNVTESNAATNHSQQKFASTTYITASSQMVALTDQLQNRNILVSHPSQAPDLSPVEPSLPGAPPQNLHFPAMETPPTGDSTVGPKFFGPIICTPHAPIDIWSKSILRITVMGTLPTLGKTLVLCLEQRLEDMMGRKIAEAMSKKSSRQQSLLLEEDLFAPEVMVVPYHETSNSPRWKSTMGQLTL